MQRKVRGKLALEWLKACLGTIAIFNKDVRHRDRYTRKTYTAGRATEMASPVFSLGDVQMAGEWSTRTAPFFCMNTDGPDRAQELKVIVGEELQEDPEEGADEENHGMDS